MVGEYTSLKVFCTILRHIDVLPDSSFPRNVFYNGIIRVPYKYNTLQTTLNTSPILNFFQKIN